MKDKPFINMEKLNTEILESSLSDTCKQLLFEYINDETEHSVLLITFGELLLSVWSIIREHKDDILKILDTEIKDTECKCFTGSMSRLINCLNGYDNRVQIRIADNQQISNILLLVKDGLGDLYTVEKHRELFQKEMTERGYDSSIINEWMEYIE